MKKILSNSVVLNLETLSVRPSVQRRSEPCLSTLAWIQKRNVWKCINYSGSTRKKKTFFFLSGVGRFLEVQTSAAHSAFFRLWCLSGVPCPVWAPLHESKNRMFENACTNWGLLRKSNFYFFCPGYGRFLRSKLFRTNFSDQEKKNDHFPTFHEKKKFFKNRFLSMIPAP